MAGASYSTANASNQPFVGHGQALFLLSASSQYVDVSNLFIRQFTIKYTPYNVNSNAHQLNLPLFSALEEDFFPHISQTKK